MLVHDQRLWQIIDGWMLELHPDVFTQVVPFLRRTFTPFSAPERRALAERARMAQREAPPSDPGSALSAGFDYERAEAALAVIRQLLSIAGD